MVAQRTAELVIVGDQAMTPEEYARYRRWCDRRNANMRRRRANDPEYRERYNAYMREWRRQHRDAHRAYMREYRRREQAA